MSSSSDEFINLTPPQVVNAAKKATLILLPEKSTDRLLTSVSKLHHMENKQRCKFIYSFKKALLIQTTISTLTGRSIRHISWAFLVLLCSLFSVIGVITLCTQTGLYMLNFLMNWPATKPRVAIATVVAAIVTFVYGQTTFCEDVYFAVGEYPCVFLRVSWAIAPLILFCTFWTTVASGSPDPGTGWALVAMAILPTFIVLLFYLIFKFRVRNIVRTEK